MHTLAVTEQGTEIHVEGDTLLLRRSTKVLRRVRIAELSQVLLFGRAEITSAAIAVLTRRRIDVVFLTRQGTFRARLIGRGTGHVVLRMAQMYSDNYLSPRGDN
jgi:CRISPR-associated protein Cas1